MTVHACELDESYRRCRTRPLALLLILASSSVNQELGRAHISTNPDGEATYVLGIYTEQTRTYCIRSTVRNLLPSQEMVSVICSILIRWESRCCRYSWLYSNHDHSFPKTYAVRSVPLPLSDSVRTGMYRAVRAILWHHGYWTGQVSRGNTTVAAHLPR